MQWGSLWGKTSACWQPNCQETPEVKALRSPFRGEKPKIRHIVLIWDQEAIAQTYFINHEM